MAFIFAWEQIQATRSTYRVSELTKQKQEELYTQSGLQVTCMQLESTRRLEEIAKTMKFAAPKETDIITIN